MTNAPARRRDRGSSAVEFALVFPLLVTLIFGIIDFGMFVNANVTTANATRDAARAASLSASESEIRAQATAGIASLSAADKASASISVTCQHPSVPCATYTEVIAGDTAIVSISITHRWLFPLWPVPALTITKTNQMRVE